jgi:hypothetical protein
MRWMAERAERPLTALIVQYTGMSERWKETLAWIERANADGLEFTGQVTLLPPSAPNTKPNVTHIHLVAQCLLRRTRWERGRSAS